MSWAAVAARRVANLSYLTSTLAVRLIHSRKLQPPQQVMFKLRAFNRHQFIYSRSRKLQRPQQVIIKLHRLHYCLRHQHKLCTISRTKHKPVSKLCRRKIFQTILSKLNNSLSCKCRNCQFLNIFQLKLQVKIISLTNSGLRLTYTIKLQIPFNRHSVRT